MLIKSVAGTKLNVNMCIVSTSQLKIQKVIAKCEQWSLFNFFFKF